MNRKSAIPISALTVATVITLADIQKNGQLPGTREWLGFVVVYTMISGAADLGLPFAGGFAILVMLTVLLTRGLDALQFITGKVSPPKKQKQKRGGKRVRPSSTNAQKV